MEPRLRDAFLAALPGGFLLLLVFFIWHWSTIAPVWTVLLEGAFGVVLAALAIAWAWTRTRRAGRFASRWGGVAFGGVFSGALLAGELIGLAHGPWPDPASAADVARELPFALVPVALVAAAGWRLADGGRGAAAYASAGLVLLLYLGGSVMHHGGRGVGLGLFSILFPGYLVAGAMMRWVTAR